MPKSFVEALRAKYCDDEEETSNFVVSFVYTNRPRKNSGQYGDAELAYLKSVVLSMYKVTHAGIPQEGLKSLCPNIMELDLSRNLIGCWNEVISIFRSLDNLKFVNLSGNSLKDPKKCLPSLSKENFGIENLVLNNTGVMWDDIVMVTKCLPHLKELHASQNDYQDITVCSKTLCQSLPKLRVLHLTDNQFSRWDNVGQLSSLPYLHTLMLSGNPLANINYFFCEEPARQDAEKEEATSEVMEVVEAIMDELVGEAVGATLMTTGMTSSSSSSSLLGSPKKSDAQSYDSGMEDCLPNTPRTGNCRERLTSSDDGELADSGYGLPKQNSDESVKSGKTSTALPTTAKDPTLSGISEHGGRVTSSMPIPGSSPRKAKEHGWRKQSKLHGSPRSVRNTSGHPSPRKGNAESDANEKNEKVSSGKISPEIEMRMDVNTDKFAYFEIEWDADDEAIGAEEEEECRAMEVEQVEEKRKEEKRKEGEKKRLQMEQEELNLASSDSFPNLKVLCVTNTSVGDWLDLESLRAFPRLDSLRIKGIPFLEDLPEDSRRKLLVASLPNVSILNGSEISTEEREKSERFFIRHFCDDPEPPSWYSDLTAKHGHLRPFVNIDLRRGYKEYANLKFIFKGRCIREESIYVVQNVSELRNYCARLVKKQRSLIRLYHLSRGGDAEEYNILNQDLLPMSRYDMMDGDEIHIDLANNQQSFQLLVSASQKHSFFIANQ